MYRTCIFCQGSLGSNPVLERFPVGRRVAFDTERGRLWAVCGECGRWNLSPLETRWEAIEEGERLYRQARARFATGEIGLARLGDGTELVRIGRPLRPEFAAWRYASRFGVRARHASAARRLRAGLGLAAVGAAATVPLLGAGMLIPAAAALLGSVVGAEGSGALGAGERETLWRLVDARRDPRAAPLLVSAQVRPEAKEPLGWQLALRFQAPPDPDVGLVPPAESHLLRGGDALHGASLLLASANARLSSPRLVRSAVAQLERTVEPRRFFAQAEERLRRSGWGYRSLWELPPEMRCAMEMATHEEAEQRSLQGELEELARRWREAEALAAVADRLGLPASVPSRLEQLRDETSSGGRAPRSPEPERPR